MYNKLTIIFLFFQCYSFFLYGQESPEDIYSGRIWRKNLCLGAQIGYGIVFSDARTSNHFVESIFMHIPLGKSLIIKPQLSFFQKKHYWNDYYFEYQGIVYHVRDAQLWRNYSLNLGLAYQKFNNVVVGFGVSSEYIQINRIEHDSNPFLLRQPDDLEILEQVTKEAFVKPGTYLTSTGFVKLSNNWAIIIEGQVKFILVGKKYGDLGTAKMICTMLVGIGYGIR